MEPEFQRSVCKKTFEIIAATNFLLEWLKILIGESHSFVIFAILLQHDLCVNSVSVFTVDSLLLSQMDAEGR